MPLSMRGITRPSLNLRESSRTLLQRNPLKNQTL
jgi:hypothetical protein